MINLRARENKQVIRIIREDLKMLVIDIKHGNKRSALNWVNLIRKGLNKFKGVDMARGRGSCGGKRRLDGSGKSKGNRGTPRQPRKK